MPAISTFEQHRDALDGVRLGSSRGLTDREIVEAIRSIDSALALVAGRGVSITPFDGYPRLRESLGLHRTVQLWVKDETNNAAGSHKVRHLFGVALDHALRRRTGEVIAGRYAIASCGNAAMAAAAIANAVQHPLDVFVPMWADKAVVEHIEALGAKVRRCERRPNTLGDPTHHALLRALAAGAVGFSCQSTETPSAVDGGRTLAYEMTAQLEAREGPGAFLHRIFLQVGGGALASAVLTGLERTTSRLPVVHPVQPTGNHPFVRAWDRVVAEHLQIPLPATNVERGRVAAKLGPLTSEACGHWQQRLASSSQPYMTPWEVPPESYATGILDDVTYDWIPVMLATLRSGGFPLVAAEDDFRRGHALAHQATKIDVCPTGAAGLGGLLAGLRAGCLEIGPNERIALCFTGKMRPNDPAPVTL